MVEVLRKRTDFVHVLPVLALLMGAASEYKLTCHCLEGSTCDTNGFCPDGCAKGWSGPGCQVGNVALNKTAQQSTNYTETNSEFVPYPANSAVDGKVPNDDGAEYCSHTETVEAANGSAWWFVTLDVKYYYVITNITLVNRRGFYGRRLSNFVILYSNETEGYPDPSNRNWYEYASENGKAGDNRTYTSNNSVIAKRVAVYLRASLDNAGAMLTLCEVLIYGYEYYDCPRGFNGPGCLLQTCDQCSSTDLHCTSEFGSCYYEVCPDQSLLPPECWITLSNISALKVSATTACNSMLLSVALPNTKPKPNIAASSLQLQVTSSSDQRLLENATVSLQGNDSATYKFRGAAADTSYTVYFKFEYCNVLGRSCFLSTGSQLLTIKTDVRQFVYSHNTSCIFVTEKSTNPECEPLSAIQISCESEVAGGVTLSSSTWTVCGIERGQAYHCFVFTNVKSKTIERQHAYIVIEVSPTSSVPNDDRGVLGGSIGGSIILVAVILAISVVVYFRQKQKARLLKSAVKLGRKENDPDLASATDVSGMPSLRKEQDDHSYESLHQDLYLKTTGDYVNF